VWVLSRQWLVLPGETVWFQCPFCHKKWRSISDKALVHCPHCRQLIHPKMTEN
jgi:DNA-directed RNA polymerase subunit RPC12/RpoP